MKILLGIIVMSILFANAAGADVLLSESWDGVTLPNSDWEIWSEDSVHWPSIDATAGNPPPSLAPGGGSAYQHSGVYSKAYQASYVENGLSIKVDACLDGGLFTDLYFGLCDTEPSWPNNFLNVHLVGNGDYVTLAVHEDGMASEHGVLPSAEWFTCEMLIRPDQRVEVYINDSLVLGPSDATVSPMYDAAAQLYLLGLEDGGPCRFDNVLVTPEPGVVTMLVFGVFLALGRRS